MKTFVTDLFLCLLFAGVALLGVNFWASRIKAEEREKVTSQLNLAWTIRLREAEQKANYALNGLKEQHAENLRAVNLQLSRTLVSLQQRPKRAEQAKPASGTAPVVEACTGARLAREDGEFLAGEAAAAAEQQSELIEARAGYETCRQALRNVTQGERNGDSSGKAPGVPGP